MSIASFTTSRIASVRYALAIAESTAGCSPASTQPGRQPSRRAHQVGETADARERLLDALEAPDRGVELLAHHRVGADHARRELRAADGHAGSEIERPTARLSISMRQPWPAMSGPR
jgi:hypothetical protein